MILGRGKLVTQSVNLAPVGVDPIVQSGDLGHIFLRQHAVLGEVLDPFAVEHLAVDHHSVAAAHLVRHHVLVDFLKRHAELLVVHLPLHNDQPVRRLGIHGQVIQQDRIGGVSKLLSKPLRVDRRAEVWCKRRKSAKNPDDTLYPGHNVCGFGAGIKPMLKVLPQESAVLEDSTLDDVAVVIPVFMGKTVLCELCERLVAALSKITCSFSITLVDDRSEDNAWPLICELGQTDRQIHGIQLSRNFGQHYALTAGLDHAHARWYVVMDCDLQDAPEDIALLYAKVNEGFDIVVGVRSKEGHGLVKRTASRSFYAVFNLLAGINLDWSLGNYRIFSNRVADGFRQMREQMRFFPASLSLMGFEVGYVPLLHHPRAQGKSSYTLGKLARLAVNTILAHSQRPLKIAAVFGLFISALSLLAALGIVIRAIFWGATVTGWASLIVAVCGLGGIQIFVTGIVGVYVGKCFEEAKKRPLYFIRETCNL